MFDLNDKIYDEAGAKEIFNGGVAGLTKGCTVSIEKRKADEPDNYPDYKVFISDGTEARPLDAGFFLNVTEDKGQSMNIQRMKSIASSLVPSGFTYPSVSSYNDAINSLAKIISEYSKTAKVNVFTSYGWTGKPSKYIGLRFFNFIEAENTTPTKLVRTTSDVMERPTVDENVRPDVKETKEKLWEL